MCVYAVVTSVQCCLYPLVKMLHDTGVFFARECLKMGCGNGVCFNASIILC